MSKRTRNRLATRKKKEPVQWTVLNEDGRLSKQQANMIGKYLSSALYEIAEHPDLPDLSAHIVVFVSTRED